MTVSQGSAAMSLRCDGICNDHFVANFVLSLTVIEFGKSLNILRSYWHEYGVLFFFDSYCSGTATEKVWSRSLVHTWTMVAVLVVVDWRYIPQELVLKCISSRYDCFKSDLVSALAHVPVLILTIPLWRRGVAVERRIRDREVAGSGLGRALWRKNSGQVSHTYG